MALIKNHTSRHGFLAPQAYAKISGIEFDFAAKTVSIFVRTYKDQGSMASGREPMEQKHYVLRNTARWQEILRDLDNGSVRRAGYLYLQKHQPDFLQASSDE